MMVNKLSCRQVPELPVNIVGNSFSAVVNVYIAIHWVIFGKSKPNFSSQTKRSPKVAQIYVQLQKKPELCVATDEMWPLR